MASPTKQFENSDAGTTMTQISDNSVPSHYVLEIDSFSMLASRKIDKVESNEFDSRGYKWKLILYPKGDKNTGNGDHVSLHVALSNKDSVKVGEEIYAFIRFSVFDQVRAKYFTKQGGAEMFNRIKLDWGISNFMPLKIFTDPSSGYLIDDKCMFGVGVFVIKSSGLGDSLSIKKTSPTHLHEWKITNFSTLGSKVTCSEDFRVGNYTWHARLHPKGVNFDDHLSLFIGLVKPVPGQKVHASYTFRFKGRDGVVHKEIQDSDWFSLLDNNWGCPNYMSLKEFKKLVVDDCCTIEVEVTVWAEVNKLP